MHQAATGLGIFVTSLAASADIRLATDFLPLPFTPGSTLIGDADGDGRTDLFLFSTSPNAVTVYFGRENNRFEPGPQHLLPGDPIASVRLADLNGDSRDDIVIPNRFAQDTIFILPADPHGAYDTQVALPTIQQPRMIALTDTDHDGAIDIVVSRGDLAAIHRNLGNLDFGPPTTFPTIGGIPTDVLAIDIHANGNPELAFLTSNAVLMYRQGADGFTLANQTSLTGTPVAMAADDTLGTGAQSLLIAYRQNTTVSILRTVNGQSYGLINPQPGATRPLTASSVAFGDISGNGRLDVLHGFEGIAPLSPLYRVSPGSPPFREIEPAIASISNLRHAHIASLNNTNRGDLILVGTQPPGIFAVMQGIEGTFRSAGQILPTNRAYRSLVPIPSTSDHAAFLATHNESGSLSKLIIRPQFPGFELTETPIQGAAGESALDWMLADLNADGRPDLVRRSTNTIRWQLAEPDGSFGLMLERNLGGFAAGITTADFDADGTADFIWFATDGRARVAHGRTTGFISPPYDLGLSGFENIGALATADLNADSIPDLVFTDRTSDNARLHVALGRGDATFHPPVTVSTIARNHGNTPSHVAIGDFNRDGVPDIVVAGLNAIAFHPGDLQQTILAPQIIPVDAAIDVAAVDLDADRRPELIVNCGNHSILLSYAPGAPLSVRRHAYNPAGTYSRGFHHIDGGGLPHLIATDPQGITIIRNHSTPACIPDVVPDGVLDFFDVVAYLRALSVGDPAADLNDDGNLDFFDIVRFFNLFSEGCP